MPRVAPAASTMKLRPRSKGKATQTPNIDKTPRGKRGGKTKSAPPRRRTEPKEVPKSYLIDEITEFEFEAPLTHPTWQEWVNGKEEFGVMYRQGKELTIGSATWMCVECYVADGVEGYVLIPPRYYGLWRRLLWGAMWFETMWGIWEEEAKKIGKKAKKTRIDNWVLVTRRMAAARAVWYRCFQRRIVEDLLIIDFDQWSDENPEDNPVLALFMEFGIRDYRDWLFDSVDEVGSDERIYLELDPTAPENVEVFGKSYVV